MDSIDVIDYTAFESESEREEREAGIPTDNDWAYWLEATYCDPAEV